ncbi:hypothetical protein [Pseudomonas sp. IT-P218]|jgi:hypothetical protein|uniref:hypothetical protein n=1 Tax=Pseudomonas sp. IT-P218 TaxID=3026449 RepID=UPI0039E1FCFE
MKSKQHSSTCCPVYLHPSACSSPAAVEAIERKTGLLVITSPKGRIEAVKSLGNVAVDISSRPFGGDAA